MSHVIEKVHPEGLVAQTGLAPTLPMARPKTRRGHPWKSQGSFD